MDDQNKNLILATALSFLVILVWFVLFPPPEPEQAPQETAVTSTEGEVGSVHRSAADTNRRREPPPRWRPRSRQRPKRPGFRSETPRLTGSISLLGGRIDDLSLKDYRVSLAEDAERRQAPLRRWVRNPLITRCYGWAPSAGLTGQDVPGPSTVWAVEQGETLGVDTPHHACLGQRQGPDLPPHHLGGPDYMFTVTQSVENTSQAGASMAPFGILARHGMGEDADLPELKNFFILHEGVIGMTDGDLDRDRLWRCAGLRDATRTRRAHAEVFQVKENGWIGFTDHYWMTTLIPADRQLQIRRQIRCSSQDLSG